MNENDEILIKEHMLSEQEIVARFRRVFGREMTPTERQSFFWDDLKLRKEST